MLFYTFLSCEHTTCLDKFFNYDLFGQVVYVHTSVALGLAAHTHDKHSRDIC